MLRKKMLRDFKQHFGQFASVCILSFLAVCLFTGLQGEVISVNTARETYHEQTNLANHWIYGDAFTDSEVDQIKKVNGITEAQGRYFEKAVGENNTTVFLYFEKNNQVSKPLVLEGEDYNPEAADKIWIAQRFATEQGIQLGDKYNVTCGKKQYTFTVAGFVWSPEYEYYKDEVDLEPDYVSTGYAFASMKACSEDTQYNQIALTSTIDDIASVEQQISKKIDGNYSVMLNRDGLTNLTTVDDEIAQHKMMSILFPVFFVAIAILTTITTMKRIVDRQRTVIGTMKAIGLDKKKIYVHYLSFGFFPSLAGAVIGALVGPVTLSPLLFRMKYYLDSSDEYMLPHFGVTYSYIYIVLVVVIVGLCTLATWFSCRNILKIAPATALRPAQPKSAKKTIFEKTRVWKSLSFSNRYNIRDIARNKARTIFGLAGTLSCMALLVCGFCARDNFQTAVSDLYVRDLMNNANMIALEKEIPIQEAESIRDQVNGELVMSETVEIRLPGDTKKGSYHMNVYEDSSIANALDENLNVIKLNRDDFTITKKTADKLGIQVGDEIEWHVYGVGAWTKTKVTRITRAPFEQGIVTTRQVIENAGYTFTPTRLITQDNIKKSFADTSSYISSVTTRTKMADLLSNYMELINLCMGFMILFAIFLVVIVLYSLGLLSFEERLKEMATLKVLGFSTRQLRNLMLQQNIILSIVGAILGIPLGHWMLGLLIASLGDNMDVPTSISIPYVLLAFVITVAFSILVNRFFSKRIRTMDMVAETKSAE